ncbi:ATP-dependent DNA helicase RecQ [Leucobacter coleopterorum]|uniref:DNA 3'-5' helicase n=1 Tax=Leucobacter coleopterorum TaxID=2714933 RepID=A0ABX6JVR3_9MICO|nr:RecQ family ATP-dependent DNA helicase [Leucobacter coleopterorum]QIM18385.1 ATP-dependent DNA helicase RecQ [Leucobacter coleopterorum]
MQTTHTPETHPLSASGLQHEAIEILAKLTGVSGPRFHDGQFEAIQTLVQGRRRALVVQRTGWGKSAVYFIATLLLRRRGAGPTLLVSPLIALMRDQVAAAARAGVRAVAINSANAHEWDSVRDALARDEVDVLLVSPERLNNPRFRDEQLPSLLERIGLLVVDEAHCISDWGHDFRPDYRRIAELIAQLPPDLPVLATTATANARVVTDVEEQLGGASVVTIRGSLARASLRLGVLELPHSRDRLGWLLSHLGELSGSGIIYTLTVAAAEDTARLLREAGHTVRAYTGRTDNDEREESERLLKDNQLKALVATSALGMGFDKPDLGFVVHLGAPSSPVAYYQQVGRAGRGTDRADVLLLPGNEDREIWHYFATASMPDEARAQAVLAALSDMPLSTPALETRVNLRRSPLELLLKVLDVDGAVRRVEGGWIATGSPWHYDAERYDRIRQARIAEQSSMIEYQRTGECRMATLQRDLDDDTAAACGRCDRCAGPWYAVGIADEAAHAAASSLDRVSVEIEPRKQWPTGAAQLGVLLNGAPVRGKITPEQQLEPGRAIARLTDLGWGNTLRDLFAPHTLDASVSESIFGACVRVLAEWNWQERPVAIVSVPSRTRPQLVESVASGLARVGRLPYLGQLSLVGDGPSGDSGGNSPYRLAAVWGGLAVGEELASAITRLSGGPILLVDDRVDSRWTMTVAGMRLREAGATAVLPFALAATA